MTAVTTDAARRVIARAAGDILDQGCCVVKLSDVEAANLQNAIATTNRFFARPHEEKIVHGSSDHNYGYRPFRIEYSVTPDRPRLNECFTVWSSRLDD